MKAHALLSLLILIPSSATGFLATPSAGGFNTKCFTTDKDCNTEPNKLDEEPADGEIEEPPVLETQRLNRLLFPQRFGDALTRVGWLFVGVGILLNSLGYGYVLSDGKLRIDTLENRQFQNEINRNFKRN